MRKSSLTRCLSSLFLAAVLAGGAVTMAQTNRRTTPVPRVPQRRLQAEPSTTTRTNNDQDLRLLIEDLENSSPEEVRSGSIGRYFTDPAVIITNGQVHRIDWSRIRDDRNSPNGDDRTNDRYRSEPNDRTNQDDRADRRTSNVRLEGYQTRRIDTRTVVVLYTAVIPDENGTVRQPVVATLVRDSSGRGWRVASYTAENAAIPGAVADEESNSLPAR
jgi:hypothetical protein